MHPTDTTHNTDPLAEHFATVPRDLSTPKNSRLEQIRQWAEALSVGAIAFLFVLYAVTIVGNLGRWAL